MSKEDNVDKIKSYIEDILGAKNYLPKNLEKKNYFVKYFKIYNL